MRCAADLPSRSSQFKRDYGELLPKFGAMPPQRVEIARFWCARLRPRWSSWTPLVDGRSPSSSRADSVPALVGRALGAPGLRAQVPFEALYRGREIDGW
jgi:hypothetical protein